MSFGLWLYREVTGSPAQAFGNDRKENNVLLSHWIPAQKHAGMTEKNKYSIMHKKTTLPA